MKAATKTIKAGKMLECISIHAAREGGDSVVAVIRFGILTFQSTPPVKAATKTQQQQPPPRTFQSTPPVKAATRQGKPKPRMQAISIHAAREGGDGFLHFGGTSDCISIHAAREGGDVCKFRDRRWAGRFQSTPPVKAATATKATYQTCRRFQSTPPVKAATTVIIGTNVEYGISIHAAREGGDAALNQTVLCPAISIHAAREGGDMSIAALIVYVCISIHAAREGGDGSLPV